MKQERFRHAAGLRLLVGGIFQLIRVLQRIAGYLCYCPWDVSAGRVHRTSDQEIRIILDVHVFSLAKRYGRVLELNHKFSGRGNLGF